MGAIPVYGYSNVYERMAEQRKSRLEMLRDIERNVPADRKFAIRRLIEMVEEFAQ